jgi:2-hydroxychromene-2-carboxylate isomerase
MQLWFDFASTYSYVAVLRVFALPPEALPASGIEWKPFLLGPLFNEQSGLRDSPFNVFPVRGRYMWRDLERLCAKLGFPWRKPGVFPRHSVLAARVACALERDPLLPEFVRAAFLANFAEDRDISDPAVLASLLPGLDEAIQRATSPEVKAKLRENTDEARRLGLFGAPSFIVGGELFFGQDRLDDALEWADDLKS